MKFKPFLRFFKLYYLLLFLFLIPYLVHKRKRQFCTSLWHTILGRINSFFSVMITPYAFCKARTGGFLVSLNWISDSKVLFLWSVYNDKFMTLLSSLKQIFAILEFQQMETTGLSLKMNCLPMNGVKVGSFHTESQEWLAVLPPASMDLSDLIA
jgi:hypothetical protein